MSASKRRKKPPQESELHRLQRLLAAEVTIRGDDGRPQQVSHRMLILMALRKKAATGDTAASTLLHRELKLYPRLKAALDEQEEPEDSVFDEFLRGGVFTVPPRADVHEVGKQLKRGMTESELQDLHRLKREAEERAGTQKALARPVEVGPPSSIDPQVDARTMNPAHYPRAVAPLTEPPKGPHPPHGGPAVAPKAVEPAKGKEAGQRRKKADRPPADDDSADAVPPEPP